MIVAITPARGGSKGIPGKNIKQIAGRPLISWTVERALESKLIDKYYVSTDDKEIKRIAKKWGAEVLDRPLELATDESLVIDTLKYHLENDCPKTKTLVILQATSPIREPGLIDYCIDEYRNSTADCLATGFDVKYAEYGTVMRRRQDMEGYFNDDGNVYVINANLIKNRQLFNDNQIHIYTSREQNPEIDDDFDFWLCEQILLKKEHEKNENR